MVDSKYGSLWSREESILAFDLYCRIPFQKTKANNPAIVELSTLLGRTPAAIARKLGNFGAFDPELRGLDISGLTHTSKLDRAIWDEFHADWNGLVWKADELRATFAEKVQGKSILERPLGHSETMRMVKQRVHQAFFRDAILSSYDSTCCITGITIRECLVASHIVPWSVDENLRTDPTNGLCLSATFDRLFDTGLMTLTEDSRIKFSSRLLKSNDPSCLKLIDGYERTPIRAPNRFLPNSDCLSWHRINRFAM